MKKNITWEEYESFMRECDPGNRYDYAFSKVYASSQEELLEKVLEHVQKKYPEGIPERLKEALKPERNYTFEKLGYYDYIQSSKLASKIMIYPIQRIYEEIWKAKSGYEYIRKEGIESDDWYSYCKLLQELDRESMRHQRGARIYARDEKELKEKVLKYINANCRHPLKDVFIRLAEFYSWFEEEGYYDIDYETMNPKMKNRNITVIMPITRLYDIYFAEFGIYKKST
ncbi:MAG: hypothetical protein GT589_08615 [Peptoclostridium sp.]|uniref:hypothetical protein n=1 Tax=Peptoclostridium sp. TaxID=1904860 RepID=UPI00139E35E6|nr:hypothetical protein [Peptoclostridium sp.]MZQ76194.1 hypothetical protein [Peptoclostridium sp.]